MDQAQTTAGRHLSRGEYAVNQPATQENNLFLDRALADEVINAVVKTMRETFDVNVIPGKPEIGSGIVSLEGDVSGVIAMVQSQLEGTLTVCLPLRTVRDVLPQVVGKSVTVTNEMAVDAVGEMTNMIFGQLKRNLNEHGHHLKLGIPSVVCGRGHFVSQFHRGKYLLVPFTLDDQVFHVHIALHSDKSTSP